MLGIIIPIAVFLVGIVAYLTAISSQQKYSDRLKESRANLSGIYVQAIAELYKEIKKVEEATRKSVKDILVVEEYISATRKIAEIIRNRDRLVDLFDQLERTNLSARYLIFVLIIHIFLALIPSQLNFQLPQIVIMIWWLVLFMLILIIVYLFLLLFLAERHFNKLVSDTLYRDHEQSL